MMFEFKEVGNQFLAGEMQNFLAFCTSGNVSHFFRKMNTTGHGDSLHKIFFIPFPLLKLFLNKIINVGFDAIFL